MSEKGDVPSGEATSPEDRRGFLQAASTTAMVGGLVASYGTFALMAGRFVYPAAAVRMGWQFVTTLDRLAAGESMDYVGPTGARVVVARQGAGETADDFIALSSVCPHLGCQVHWESVNERFFCPCHNGAFDSQGRATEGPPASAQQALKRFPLKVENGLLFIQVPLEAVSLGGREEGTA